MKPNSTQTSAAKIQFQSRLLTRRRFIRQTSGLVAGLGLSGLVSSALAAKRNKGLPTPGKSGIEHVVVVTMENRSF
jgi:phospholipase C